MMAQHGSGRLGVLTVEGDEGWSVAELREALGRRGVVVESIRSPEELPSVAGRSGTVLVVTGPRSAIGLGEVLRELLSHRPSAVLLALDRHLMHELEVPLPRRQVIGFRAFQGARGRTSVELLAGPEVPGEVLDSVTSLLRAAGINALQLRGADPGPVAPRVVAAYAAQAGALVRNGEPPEAVEAAAVHRLCFGLGPIGAVRSFSRERLEEALRVSERSGDAAEGLDVMRDLLGDSDSAAVPDPVPPVDRMWSVDSALLLAGVVGELSLLASEIGVDRAELDTYVRDLLGSPVGPLAYADLLGLDAIAQSLRRGPVPSRWERGLKPLIERGELGAKSGRGFLRWHVELAEEGKVRYELRGAYALITLSRPERLNALDEGMWRGLRSALRRANGDDRVRAVLVKGEGRAFSAGDDIAMMAAWKGFGDAKAWHDELLMPLLRELLEHSKPLIALVDGIAFGGGCELLLGFDVVVASERSLFSVPEVLIGAIPPIASSLGPAFLGRKIARYALTGEWMTADQARELGIVDVVVHHSQLEQVGVEFVVKVIRSSPQSIRSVKEVIAALRSAQWPLLALGANRLVSLASTEEFREGMEAFLGRRSPRWFLGKK